jgi:hypothetical protein
MAQVYLDDFDDDMPLVIYMLHCAMALLPHLKT